MNKFTLSLIMFGILILGEVKAQPQTAQWSFYLAFEDATGAMDSLWYVLDTAATSPNLWSTNSPYTTGQDPQFGDEPITLNDSIFSVSMERVGSFDTLEDGSITNIQGAHFDVVALPLNQPYFGGGDIFAHNYVLPITMTYDLSILSEPTILNLLGQPMNNGLMDNNYLFNFDDSGAFCLGIHNELVLPYFEIQGVEAEHFPLFFTLTPGWGCGGLSVKEWRSFDVTLYPNPAAEIILIQSREDFDQVEIFDLSGKRVLNISAQNGLAQSTIDVSTLNSGMYVLSIHNKTGWGFAKFVKE